MNFIELLKKNKSLVYWNRCRIHRNDEKFRDMVMNSFHSPDYFKIEHLGDEYSGKIVYVVLALGDGVGFFGELGTVLTGLKFADDYGFTPYVMWGSNFLYYEEDGVDEISNAFEYYFEPVSEVISIKRVSNLIRLEYSHIEKIKVDYGVHSYERTPEYFELMVSMMRKYIKLNTKTQSHLDQAIGKLWIDRNATLGVHYRGTDYARQYDNHPVAPSLVQTMEKVDDLMGKYHYQYIFLATDEANVVKKFREKYGKCVRVHEDVFRNIDGDDSVAFSHSSRKDHHYLLGLEVIKDAYTLAICKSLVCGRSNVTYMANVMKQSWLNEKYERYELIDLGVHHNANSFGDSVHE